MTRADPGSALRGKRILVIEDEFIIAAMVEEMLLELGATPLGPAGSVPEAHALLSRLEVDGVLLDVNLNGVMTETVAAELRGRNMPFVVATGYGAPPWQETAPTLNKPYTIEALVASFALVLARR
ncbi:MAG: response regulator [Pseudomonadota bacterium]